MVKHLGFIGKQEKQILWHISCWCKYLPVTIELNSLKPINREQYQLKKTVFESFSNLAHKLFFFFLCQKPFSFFIFLTPYHLYAPDNFIDYFINDFLVYLWMCREVLCASIVEDNSIILSKLFTLFFASTFTKNKFRESWENLLWVQEIK